MTGDKLGRKSYSREGGAVEEAGRKKRWVRHGKLEEAWGKGGRFWWRGMSREEEGGGQTLGGGGGDCGECEREGEGGEA